MNSKQSPTPGLVTEDGTKPPLGGAAGSAQQSDICTNTHLMGVLPDVHKYTHTP